MATDGAQWVGARDSGTKATVREVASCAPPCFCVCAPLAFRVAVKVQSDEVFPRIPTSVSGRGCCRRCLGRGEEVGSGNRSTWGRQHPCLRFARSIADCPEQEQVASRFGAGGVVPEVLGTGQAESVKSSRRHRQGHRTESSSRGGGCRGGSADSPNCSWKLRSQLGKFLHRCQSCRVRSMRSSWTRRQAKWMGTGPPSVDAIPPMPTDPQELEGWLSDRNCDLRNAIEFGNPGLVSQIGV